MKKYLLAGFLIFCFVISHAQRKVYSTTNPNAIRALEDANQYYNKRQDLSAIEEAEKAILYDPNFIEPHFLLANIYSDARNWDKAIENYREAVAINPDFFPKALLTLGRLEFTSAAYDSAKKHLEKFISYPEMLEDQVKEAKKIIRNCDFAAYAFKHPVAFVPTNLGDSINSNLNEYLPTITADGSTFIFTRDLLSKPRQSQEDFFCKLQD